MVAIIVIVIVVMASIWAVKVASVVVVAIAATLWGRWCERCRAFDKLVEFAAVKPDAPACWAKINFYSLPVGNSERCLIDWTFHSSHCNALWPLTANL